MSYRTAYRTAIGEYFHVYNRGVRRAQIFDSRLNYDYLVNKLQSALTDAGVNTICLCLMPNHFHFLLEQTRLDGISRLMQQVCHSYAKALNSQRRQTGHVFESKYKIKLIDSTSYLTWLSRYIHRNPKVAGLVRDCIEWEYSSFLDFVGLGKHGFICPDVVLSQFASSDDYRRYVEDDAEKEPPGLRKYLFDW
jgi:putative transposase